MNTASVLFFIFLIFRTINCFGYDDNWLFNQFKDTINNIKEMEAKTGQKLKPLRVSHFDMAFGRDIQEVNKLNGYGIVVFYSIAQDPTELPLKRAKLKVGKNLIYLTEIGNMKDQSDNREVSENLGRMFSANYYLIHYSQVNQGGTFLIDFAKNKSNFSLSFDPFVNMPGSKGFNNSNKSYSLEEIDFDVLNGFAKREFSLTLNKEEFKNIK